MNRNFLVIFVIFLINLNISLCNGKFGSKNRDKRFLVFPVSAVQRVMYIYGIGIPLTDLEYESLTTGWVLKSQYILPYRAEELRLTEIRPQAIAYKPPSSGKKRSLDDEMYFNESNSFKETNSNGTEYITYPEIDYDNLPGYRWMLYKGVQLLLDRNGKNQGRPCLLKSICETASSPFHYSGGIISEIVHIIMTPSISSDILSHHSDNEFLYAEKVGKSGAPCERIFHECNGSILDKLTNIFYV